MAQPAQPEPSRDDAPSSSGKRPFRDYYPDHLSHCYGCGRLNAQGPRIKGHCALALDRRWRRGRVLNIVATYAEHAQQIGS